MNTHRDRGIRQYAMHSLEIITSKEAVKPLINIIQNMFFLPDVIWRFRCSSSPTSPHIFC
ncbi:MAG: hypothetical protein O4861_14955 [Trichodesmium sp. St16_bin4-tuft]|nr:hypothetical protein [Trichodesmium sp. MAG_R01]MDE5069270.1 hypothetical protein [Trichodesmium sp. St4_bin8_1]MDE5070781.1 hypothetical protein [Trichodesmium sp. St5_bin8]MDE5091149.1 hypothetical protein [Trichodesmium sp. St18_bin3_1_1]MDE5099556.1 hypothetical protein [Trichodesmium sp. St16_bin4-tuft]MDE5105462.1 hypothetical protein [Trichodesmium sp. St19_bin2]